MLKRKKKRSFAQIFQDHILTSARCAEQLLDLFTDFSSAPRCFQKIIESEHLADRLVEETYRLIDITFISQYDKPDIVHLISNLDDLIDYIKKVTNSLQVYRIVKLRPEALLFARIIVEMFEHLRAAVGSIASIAMDTLIEHAARVKELEEKADSLLNQAMQNLFDEEDDPKMVIKWKDIFEKLETITDHADRVINIMCSIVRKERL